MSPRHLTWAIVTMAATLTLTAAPQDQAPPVFRSQATAVSLDVSVLRGNRPVIGLMPADFEVSDNGIPQTVEQVLTDQVPLDVTLILDASGGTPSSLELLSGATASIFDDMRREAQRILERLRPDDRARVLISNTVPYELRPLHATGKAFVLPETGVPGGWSSIHDAILAGLVARPDRDRRRLLIAIIGGVDRTSVTSVHSLEQVARRTETVLHIISVRAELAVRISEPDRDALVRPWGGTDGFIRDFPTTEEKDLLERLPSLTGGAFHGPSPDSRSGRNPDTVAAARRVIEEFRQSYVVQYTPRNVATNGWHTVSVGVKGVDSKGVRTRAGYFDTAR